MLQYFYNAPAAKELLFQSIILLRTLQKCKKIYPNIGLFHSKSNIRVLLRSKSPDNVSRPVSSYRAGQGGGVGTFGDRSQTSPELLLCGTAQFVGRALTVVVRLESTCEVNSEWSRTTPPTGQGAHHRAPLV